MNDAVGAWRRVISSNTSVPLAFTVKSVIGSFAAQSCDGCAAAWITVAIEPAWRRNTASIASASRMSASTWR